MDKKKYLFLYRTESGNEFNTVCEGKTKEEAMTDFQKWFGIGTIILNIIDLS
jgi:hypothetical protein